jgi:FMN phosphatase YigB (HAD superfamily)
MKKPDPRIYEIACRKLQIEPAEAVFLDDMPINVEGAARVGMTAVRFIENQQATAALEIRLAGRDRP